MNFQKCRVIPSSTDESSQIKPVTIGWKHEIQHQLAYILQVGYKFGIFTFISRLIMSLLSGSYCLGRQIKKSRLIWVTYNIIYCTSRYNKQYQLSLTHFHERSMLPTCRLLDLKSSLRKHPFILNTQTSEKYDLWRLCQLSLNINISLYRISRHNSYPLVQTSIAWKLSNTISKFRAVTMFVILTHKNASHKICR
jgi:hypothetical protein